MNDYTLQFCTLAATSSWNEAVLITVFRQGLNVNISQQMAIYDDVVGQETSLREQYATFNASQPAIWKSLLYLLYPPHLQHQNRCR